MGVWFVTGSSRGLGRAIVEAALEKGHCVVATARRPAGLDDLVQKYGDDRVLTPLLDVTDKDQVVAAVDAGLAKFGGRLDVVVNNAGYAVAASLEDMSLSDFQDQINVNFFGVVYVTKAVIPTLRRQNSGHIIQISSVGERVSNPGLSANLAAKWAVGGFSASVQQEVAPFGVKVTVLEPGGIRTDWADSSLKRSDQISDPYKPTVGRVAAMLRDMAPTMVSIPSKVAQIILDVVDQEDPPLRLLVGSDAVKAAERERVALQESDKKWEWLSVTSS